MTPGPAPEWTEEAALPDEASSLSGAYSGKRFIPNLSRLMRLHGQETYCVGRDGVPPASLNAWLSAARAAQRGWAAQSMRDRLKVIRLCRQQLAHNGGGHAVALAGSGAHPFPRRVSEVFSAEVLPLADAARFLEKRADRLLRPTRLGMRGRPLWLWGVDAVVHREPRGVVLIVGASNYPLLLPGVVALQALAAGNAVVLKPGKGGLTAARLLHQMFLLAGLPAGLFMVTDDSAETARALIEMKVDFVQLTGGRESGRAVLRYCAERLTPACVELSGCDAAFVLPGADLDRVAQLLAFGLGFNGSRTCIAPRRLLVSDEVPGGFETLMAKLRVELAARGPVGVDPEVMRRLMPLVAEAEAAGALRVAGAWTDGAAEAEPFVLTGVEPTMALAQTDLFAPVLSVLRGETSQSLIEIDQACPYALGASVFGDRGAAGRLARQVRAGSVVVNDLIVPTADPRLPFGGRDDSGFGVTRGAEGLLELTRIKTVSTRKRFYPHLRPSDSVTLKELGALLRFTHGRGPMARLGAAWTLGCSALRLGRPRR